MSLNSIINDINKRKKFSLITQGIGGKEYSKIPFTSPRLNYMTYGGIPRACITEFSGIEGSGKTTSALDIVKNAQIIFRDEYDKEKNAKGEDKAILKKVIYADCENTLDDEWAKLIGVDIENLIVLKPQEENAEEIFDILVELMESGEVGLLVIDSLGVLVSAQAYEKSIEQKTYGGIAMALTLFSKKAVMLCNKYKITIIGINQVREDLSNPYGGLTTTGGKAWRHNCMLRLVFSRGRFIDSKNNEISNKAAETPCGNIVDVAIEKTKSCRPDRRRGYYILNYEKGIDYIADLIEIGLMLDIITQKGAYFYFYEENGDIVKHKEVDMVFQGKNKLYSYLLENIDFREQLVEAIG